MAIRPIQIIFAGVDKFSHIADMASKKLDKVANRAKVIGTKMESIGSKMSTTFTLPIVAFGVLSAQAAGKYEEALSRVNTMTSATTQEITALTNLTPKLTKEFRGLFSKGEIAEGARLMADSGFKINQIMSGLPQVLRLSAMSYTTLGQAVEVVDNLTEGYGIKIENLAEFNDKLAQASRRGGVSVDKLANAMIEFSPTAQAFNISLDDALNTFGTFGQMGIKMEKAAMGVKTGLASLMQPASDAAEVLNRLGIRRSDIFDKTTGKLISLENLFTKLKKSGMTTQDAITIFGTRAGAVIAAMAQQSTGKLAEFTKEMKNAKGASDALVNARLENFNTKMKSFTDTMNDLQITFGNILIPIIVPALQKINKLMEKLGEHPRLLKFLVITGMIVAALGPLTWIIGRAIWFVGLFAKGFGALLTIGKLVVPLVKLMAIGLSTAFKTIGTALVGAGAFLANASIVISAATAAFLLTRQLLKATGWEKKLEGLGSKLYQFTHKKNMNYEPSYAQGQGQAIPSAASYMESVRTNRIMQTDNTKVEIDFKNLPKGAVVTSKEGKVDLTGAYNGNLAWSF